jgi:hypothetical protein
MMTKAPQAGRVKTRLVPPLTPDEAAELNKCFLRDTAAAISIACSRRPVGDANALHPPSRSFGVAGSEAATEFAFRRRTLNFYSSWLSI